MALVSEPSLRNAIAHAATTLTACCRESLQAAVGDSTLSPVDFSGYRAMEGPPSKPTKRGVLAVFESGLRTISGPETFEARPADRIGPIDGATGRGRESSPVLTGDARLIDSLLDSQR
ncbi:hypothetical protein AXG93_2727s1100 [Marchantia polymorpha subsp. ruderalis]|uniref:Uncharacterized protein n=1 Tax=Marchantia polymorpha subsp. ruderalis TaxID=1480154 RepID=A0A176VBW5_MARPO|nr:hypothetical protein AXG93_2727s1100 [Marchantia polymorpha subsp. ruderalis]